METNDLKRPLAHWRKETIYWGSIAVAIMDKLEGLNTEEKFSHLAIDDVVKKCMREAGISDHSIPKEFTALTEKGDQIEMNLEAREAVKNFRKANKKRAWFSRQQVRQNFSSLHV